LKKFIPVLCENLKNEKKLYTKIAICESLSSFGEDSIKYLIPMLGTVGKNRHKEVPEKLFGKVNYPLPRDIAARVLIRIGVPALPYLEEVLENGNDYQKPEAVDAIGFISFYEKNESSLYALISLYKKCKDKDELLEWKIIRALESFKSAESIDILKDVSENHENKIIRLEAGRSLSHMKRIKKINYRIR
jgi:hypothetical protein